MTLRPTPYLCLLGAIFLARTAKFATVPFLYLIVSEGGTSGLLWASGAVAAAPLVSSVIGLYGGVLADRTDRRRVMTVSCLAAAAVFAGFALAGGPLAFIALSALLGVTQGFFEPASQSTLAGLVPPDRRRSAFGHRYLAINAAAALGPLAGGGLALAHPSLAFLATAGLMLVAAALSRAVPDCTATGPASGAPPPSVRDLCRLALTDTAAQLCFAAGFVLMIVYSQISSTLSVYVGRSVENGVAFFATLLALNGALIVAVQLPMTALSERVGLAGSIVLGTGLFAAGMALPPVLGAEAWTFVAMMVLVTLGEALLFPISNSVFADLAAENTRSTYMGLFNATMLGLAAGPVLGSALAGWLGFDGLALAMAASILCCGGLYWMATQSRSLSRTAP